MAKATRVRIKLVSTAGSGHFYVHEKNPRKTTEKPGGTFSLTFTNAGYYPYYCFTHRTTNPEHTGTVSVVTGPSNPPSAVTILNPTLIGCAFKFSFATQVGYNYSGQFTPSLNPTNWSAFTNVAGNGSVVQFTDSSLTNSTRYYRVLAQ